MRPSALTRTWLGWGLLCGLPLLVADQWLKRLVVQTFSLNDGLSCWSGYLQFMYVRNPGLAFGLLQRVPTVWRSWLFLGLTALALGVIVAMLWRAAKFSRLLQAVITLISAGAVGNLIDRFVCGAVIDFMVLRLGNVSLPAFNLADFYIVLGLCGLVVHSWLDTDGIGF
ncbi:MAG: Lipoprotein signal peptidase [Deltaproteobacteria bacterium ADurb.Bin510]|nr:MAG: Lipoprotein signal peptidase [Deltaproteobacteria bacterium ADurb.Bin510]